MVNKLMFTILCGYLLINVTRPTDILTHTKQFVHLRCSNNQLHLKFTGKIVQSKFLDCKNCISQNK